VHATYAAAGVEAVQVRHQRVQHDDVGRPVEQHVQRFFAAVGFCDVEATVAQTQGCQQQVDLIVVDEQHLGRSGLRRVGKWVDRCHGCGESLSIIPAA
jgi:hypothetical protein